jgi:hypothetical protein
MSALVHKQTFRTAIPMAALPPKADTYGAAVRVRFGPKADSCNAAKWSLLDRLKWRGSDHQNGNN